MRQCMQTPAQPHDRAFIDLQNVLYLIDNTNKNVTVYHIQPNKIVRMKSLSFDQFFDCGHRKWYFDSFIIAYQTQNDESY